MNSEFQGDFGDILTKTEISFVHFSCVVRHCGNAKL